MLKPDWVEETYGTSYEEIVASWGYEVLSFDTCGSYQGDILVLLADGEKRGFVVIGYGSCSGCDLLESVQPSSSDGDWSGVEEIRNDLHERVHWELDAAAMVQYIETKDAANEWWLHDDEIRGVLNRYREMLTGQT